MKEYIYQFYNQGFGLIFCKRPIDYINKKVKNKHISKIINIFIKTLYTVIILALAVLIFIYKWPL